MKASIRIPRIAAARAAERCHYVKISGARCGSPALHGQRLCYFHNRMRLLRHRPGPFPPLEDGASIQYALMCVLNDIRENRIDHRTAGLLLYGLQTASANLKRVDLYVYSADAILDDPGDLLADPLSSSSCSRPATSDEGVDSFSSSGSRLTTRDSRLSSPDDRLDINACADPAYLKKPPATPGSRAATRQEIRQEWNVHKRQAGLRAGPFYRPQPVEKQSLWPPLQLSGRASRLTSLTFTTGRH